MNEIKTYSPKMVAITFGGTLVEGWDTVKITRQSQSFKQVNGIRGKNTRVALKNTAATVEITVPQTSDINTIFSQIVAIDEATGAARIDITIKDTLGTEVFKSSEAYLVAPADRSYESSSTGRSWTLNCLSSKYSSDGNGWSISSFFDAIF